MPNKAPRPIVHELDMIRAKRGVSILEWARMAGIARQTVYRALDEKNAISFIIIEKLANALGVQIGIIYPEPSDKETQ